MGKRRAPKSFERPIAVCEAEVCPSPANAADKAACGQKVGTQTLLDYLYRLRIGANYGDSALFTDGPDDERCRTTCIGG